MTTITTIEDLLRAARDNQEFREAFRREILTDDLINLPQRFEAFASETTKNIAENSRDIKALTQNVAENTRNIKALTQRVDELTQNVAELTQRVDDLTQIVAENSRDIKALTQSVAENSRDIKALTQIVAENSRDIKALTQSVAEIRSSHRAEHEALHRFRGSYAIDATRNNRYNIANRFAETRGVSRYRLRTLTPEERDDLFDDNIDAIDLLDTEGNISESFPNGDLIAKISYRKSLDTIFYIAVEASYTVNADDVIRASDHAKLLREVTGHEAFAIVSGVVVNPKIGDEYRQRIIHDLVAYMESERDDVVLWFQLVDRSLEPSPPC